MLLVKKTEEDMIMIDEQTRRSVETMCLCGLDLLALIECFPKIDASVLQEVYASVKNEVVDTDTISVKCNCS